MEGRRRVIYRELLAEERGFFVTELNRQAAEAAAFLAATDLGLTRSPGVRWFVEEHRFGRGLSMLGDRIQEEAYRTFTMDGPPNGLRGSYVPGQSEIWLKPQGFDLDCAETAAHETYHYAQYQRLSAAELAAQRQSGRAESDADAFAVEFIARRADDLRRLAADMAGLTAGRY
jgi:hypothetical protein